jgi:hypothetical protein
VAYDGVLGATLGVGGRGRGDSSARGGGVADLARRLEDLTVDEQ